MSGRATNAMPDLLLRENLTCGPSTTVYPARRASRIRGAVATSLNFSAAAAALNVTPAAVSQRSRRSRGTFRCLCSDAMAGGWKSPTRAWSCCRRCATGWSGWNRRCIRSSSIAAPGRSRSACWRPFFKCGCCRGFERFAANTPRSIYVPYLAGMIDFSRTSTHVAIRFGRGDYANLHTEKLMDDWLVPVASPDSSSNRRDRAWHGPAQAAVARERYGALERLAQSGRRDCVEFARAEHRRLGRAAGRGRRGARFRARAVDTRDPRSAEGLAETREQGSAAVRIRLLFRVSAGLPGTAEGRAFSRVDLAAAREFPPPASVRSGRESSRQTRIADACLT